MIRSEGGGGQARESKRAREQEESCSGTPGGLSRPGQARASKHCQSWPACQPAPAAARAHHLDVPQEGALEAGDHSEVPRVLGLPGVRDESGPVTFQAGKAERRGSGEEGRRVLEGARRHGGRGGDGGERRGGASLGSSVERQVALGEESGRVCGRARLSLYAPRPPRPGKPH